MALIGFLDTKLEEHTFVYERLTALGCDVTVMDISTGVSVLSVLKHVVFESTSRAMLSILASQPNPMPQIISSLKFIPTDHITSLKRQNLPIHSFQ